jgi:hypothetical protein
MTYYNQNLTVNAEHFVILPNTSGFTNDVYLVDNSGSNVLFINGFQGYSIHYQGAGNQPSGSNSTQEIPLASVSSGGTNGCNTYWFTLVAPTNAPSRSTYCDQSMPAPTIGGTGGWQHTQTAICSTTGGSTGSCENPTISVEMAIPPDFPSSIRNLPS